MSLSREKRKQYDVDESAEEVDRNIADLTECPSNTEDHQIGTSEKSTPTKSSVTVTKTKSNE